MTIPIHKQLEIKDITQKPNLALHINCVEWKSILIILSKVIDINEENAGKMHYNTQNWYLRQTHLF